MPFIIKQNDKRPYLTFQFFQADGTTPLDVSSATEINFVMRLTAGGAANPTKIKSACVMTNAIQGIGEYRWGGEEDTADAGMFEYEFEITWANGDIQTIPADGYFTLQIIDDLG